MKVEVIKDAKQLQDIMARLTGNNGLSEAEQIRALIDTFRAYSAPCPFKPGDLVTPRATSTLAGAGKPFVVLDVNSDAEPLFSDDIEATGANRFGMRPQIRVAGFSNGAVAAWWNEHHEYEPYVGSHPVTPNA